MCKLWFLLGIFIQSLVPKLCLRKQRGGLTQRAFTLSPDGARGHQSPVRVAHPKRPAARAASYGSSRAGARAVHSAAPVHDPLPEADAPPTRSSFSDIEAQASASGGR